jgi:arabinan endo-1,5-alpha-L-arabinosidase
VRRLPAAGRFAVATLAAVLTFGLSGCAMDDSDGNAADPSGSKPAAASGALAPVIDRDFPDPDVLATAGRYYLYATNDARRNVQVAESADLAEWEMLDEDALPVLPEWVIPGKTWAPEVTEVAPGRFVMYTTTTNFSPSRQCIAVATSESPTGPFTVQGDGMLVCPDEEGGAIDASTFREDDGSLHLLWKNDGNCCGLDTWLQTAPLSADGLSLTGPPAQLLMQTLEWEGDLVEAPTLVKRDGVYHLFYSANSYGDERYAVGHATASALAGPWMKDPEPFFSTASTDGVLVGPGGQDIVTDAAGDDVFFVHAWDADLLARKVYTFQLAWEDGVPRVIIEG